MDQDAADIRRILDQVPLSLLQFHGAEDAAFCRAFGLPYIKALAMGSSPSLIRAQAEFADAAALLLDSHRRGEIGGSGKTFDWDAISASLASLDRPVILAGGLTPANVRQAVREVRPWAVDVSSGIEDAPGMKNVAKMQIFIREAKSEY
jgi:phosphoribosylanthranilate isomerase